MHEQLLHSLYSIAGFQQGGGKTVSENNRGDLLFHSCPVVSGFNVSAEAARAWTVAFDPAGVAYSVR